MKVSSDYKSENFKKERGLPRSLSFGLRELQVACRGFTRAAVSLNLERYLLTFNEPAQTGALKCADMDEYVLAAVIGLNEAVAFLTVVPFHDAHIHGGSPFASDAQSRVTQHAAAVFELWGEK